MGSLHGPSMLISMLMSSLHGPSMLMLVVPVVPCMLMLVVPVVPFPRDVGGVGGARGAISAC